MLLSERFRIVIGKQKSRSCGSDRYVICHPPEGVGKTQIRRITFCRAARDGFGAEEGVGVREIFFSELTRGVNVEGWKIGFAIKSVVLLSCFLRGAKRCKETSMSLHTVQ